MLISVVTPAYKCEGCIRPLYDRLVATFKKMDVEYEIIYVNDASPQNDWLEIKKICEIDKNVKGIKLSRNFGQHYAITAGLDYTNGDWVVVMDCDLQSLPEDIIKLYNKAQNGFDVVFGKRVQRKDNFLKKFGSNVFRIVYEYFTETKFDNSVANFSISRKNVIDNVRKLKEQNRAFGLFVKWVGFNMGYIDIEHAERYEGKSSYNLKKLIKLAMDSIIAHSNKPLRISIEFGFFISGISVIYALYLIIQYFFMGVHVEGWTSVMVSVWFIGGLMFANMGVLGLYIGKLFDEAKDRPLYIIREILN